MKFFQSLGNSLFGHRPSPAVSPEHPANSQKTLVKNDFDYSALMQNLFSGKFPPELTLKIFIHALGFDLKSIDDDKNRLLALRKLQAVNGFAFHFLRHHAASLWKEIIPDRIKTIIDCSMFYVQNIPFNPRVFYYSDRFAKHPANFLVYMTYENEAEDRSDIPKVDIAFIPRNKIEPHLGSLLVASLYYKYRLQRNVGLRDKLTTFLELLNKGEDNDFRALKRVQDLLHHNFSFCFEVVAELLKLAEKKPEILDTGRLYTLFSMFDEKLTALLEDGHITSTSILAQISPDLKLQPAMKFIKAVKATPPGTPTKAEIGTAEYCPHPSALVSRASSSCTA